jgi:transcriptional activator SPT7
MSSRGRAAPGKTSKKGAAVARKAPDENGNDTPGPESKPSLKILGIASANNRTEFLRADSDAPLEGSVNGFSTPPPGSITPAGASGIIASGAPGSQTDGMDIDGPSINGITFNQGLGVSNEDPENDDLEYKTWKQVTKKDRALVAAERHRLFKSDKINPEEPALLRTKAGMRRWDRQQRQAVVDGASGNDAGAVEERGSGDISKAGETLAEGMEGEEERVLPDYYDALAVIPKISDRLKWTEDSEGQIVDQAEECLRVVPNGHFTAPESALTMKIDANIRQMQETRRVCSKIGVIKQMQVQSQVRSKAFMRLHDTHSRIRCIKINSKSTTQRSLLSKISVLMSSLMMDLS